MKLFIIIALLAISAFALEAPPMIRSPRSISRMKVRKQLEDAVAVGLTADATASISTSFFNHVLADIDAYINAIGTSIVIPGQSEKHYGFNPIHFSKLSVGAITVSTAAPNHVIVDITNVEITVPDTNFHVKADRLFHCQGHFSVDVQGGDFKITLDMANGGGGHITTTATVAASYSKLQISHKFDHDVCKVANDIIKMVIGNIDSLIDKVIRKDLPAKLGPAMTKSFDAMFAKIPLYFTGAPTVVSQGISVTVDLLANVKSFPQAVAQRLSKLNDFSHDLTLSVPQTAINNILIVAQSQGKLQYDLRLKETTKILKDLIPTAYDACPDCPLDLTFDLVQAPTLTFENNDIYAVIKYMDVNFRAFNASKNDVIQLFGINSNITAGVNNLTIRKEGAISNLYFRVAISEIHVDLTSTNVGPLPLLPAVADLLEHVIVDLAVPVFNDAFKGFDFPALFDNVAVSALHETFQFETDLLLPPI